MAGSIDSRARSSVGGMYAVRVLMLLVLCAGCTRHAQRSPQVGSGGGTSASVAGQGVLDGKAGGGGTSSLSAGAGTGGGSGGAGAGMQSGGNQRVSDAGAGRGMAGTEAGHGAAGVGAGGVGAGGGAGGGAGAAGAAVGAGGTMSTPLTKRYGFTLDAVDGLADIVNSLRKLPKRALVRIVFDYPEQPSSYTDAVAQIAAAADIVGQPSDSTYSSKMSVSEYAARFEAYVSAFPEIEIWEACNECNGDWGGPNTAAQAEAAYDVIKAHGKSALYTPYWNTPGCADKNGDYLAWTKAKLSDKLKQGSDFVTVSIYGMDCEGSEPTYDELNAMFDQLGMIFPNAQLGIGEYGAAKTADKQRILQYYLDYSSPHPRYIFWGGYWYGRQDFVPASKALWQVFADGEK